MTSVTPASAEVPAELRVVPRQQRARETVRHILDTAASLLDEVGVGGFNTNLLAERAGVRVRTVYRYFPNKTAVLLALGERALSEIDLWIRADMGEIEGWQAGLETATHRLYQRMRTHAGHAAIRRAMRAVPELHELDQRDNARLARVCARELRRIKPEISDAQARRVGRCFIESTIAVLDLALQESPARGRALVDEAVRMQNVYLASVIEN